MTSTVGGGNGGAGRKPRTGKGAKGTGMGYHGHPNGATTPAKGGGYHGKPPATGGGAPKRPTRPTPPKPTRAPQPHRHIG